MAGEPPKIATNSKRALPHTPPVFLRPALIPHGQACRHDIDEAPDRRLRQHTHPAWATPPFPCHSGLLFLIWMDKSFSHDSTARPVLSNRRSVRKDEKRHEKPHYPLAPPFYRRRILPGRLSPVRGGGPLAHRSGGTHRTNRTRPHYLFQPRPRLLRPLPAKPANRFPPPSAKRCGGCGCHIWPCRSKGNRLSATGWMRSSKPRSRPGMNALFVQVRPVWRRVVPVGPLPL